MRFGIIGVPGKDGLVNSNLKKERYTSKKVKSGII